MQYENILNEIINILVNKYETVYSNNSIKFKDDLNPLEFNEIFQMIINHFGEPNYYSSNRGYIWDKGYHFISFGIVALNYNYEVPMIYIFNEIHKYDKIIDYKEYNLIANIMYLTVEENGCIITNKDFYKIVYINNIGYVVGIKFEETFMALTYNNVESILIFLLKIYLLGTPGAGITKPTSTLL